MRKPLILMVHLVVQMIDFKTAENEAKTKHLNIWQYGDITEDDAREFGVAR